jgi:N,N'-diacetylchitobiose phosphorylase
MPAPWRSNRSIVPAPPVEPVDRGYLGPAAALGRSECSGSSELGGNHCGSLQHRFSLAPGEETRFVFKLGVGPRNSAGYVMQKKYSNLANVDEAFAALADYWKRKKAVLAVKTPSEAMNTMINTWTLFQAETCVMWSRFASFVEVGGRTGLGYRDTAQDVLSVVHTNPTKTKQRIVELLRGQVSAGYGLHLFDPDVFDPAPKPYKEGAKLPTVVPTPTPSDVIHGLADACSDDQLWLVPSIVAWVKETGDVAFLDEGIAFADGERATVYEHMKRALDFSAEQVGPNGVCKGLRADWNDCLNLGGGETALVTFLHIWAIPCIPSDWNGFHVSRQWRRATYEIEVQNPKSVEKGVGSVTLNGKPINGPIPPQPAGSTNAVVVVMG